MSTELLQQRYQRQIGWTVDKYTIEALLGIGGMAAVFRARHRNGNPVALKVLHAENSLDPDTRARFLREGYTANKVGHEGAVRVLDEGMTADGTVFLVMELLEGETLDERWERHGQTLSVKDVASISHQILDVLAAAHEKSIVHRDIKPDNIFIAQTPDGEVPKLLDFGIAKLLDADDATSVQTGSAAFVGTPRYMSPERLSHSAYGEESDVYSLGVVIYEMILGSAPWAASPDVFSLVAQIVAGRVVPMQDLGVPAVVSAIVMRALSPEPEARLTAMELVGELSAVRQTCSAPELEKVYGQAAASRTDERTISGPLATYPETLIRTDVSRAEPTQDTLAPTSAVRRKEGEPEIPGRKRG
jgi:serine/threonine-protein kinase